MHAEFEDKKFYKLLAVSLIRPFRLIGTQPIIQVLALYQAYIFGLFYFIFTSFTELFTNNYHESVGITSLNYIPLALGFILGTQLVARLSDPIYCRLKAKNNGIGKSGIPHSPHDPWIFPNPYRPVLVRLERSSVNPLKNARHRRRHIRRGLYPLSAVQLDVHHR